MNLDYIFYNILRLTVYFNLGEDIGSRERHGTRLKAQNEKHEKLVHILLNSAYFRRKKIRNAIIPLTELMTEHHDRVTTSRQDMTEYVVVVVKLQHHARI